MQLSWRICRGPRRVPGRFDVPTSRGMPTKQASRPSAVGCDGRRIIVPGPAKRGISLPPRGWLKVVMEASKSHEFEVVLRLFRSADGVGRPASDGLLSE